MLRRLGFVFALLTALATVLVAAGGSYFSYRKQQGVDEAGARDRGDRSSSMLARVLTQAVADYDLTTMEQHLDSVLKDPEVLKIEVLDAKDAAITEKVKTAPDANDWVYVKEIQRDAQKVGSVKLSFSSQRFLEASHAALQRAAVLTLATVAVIVLLLGFLFRSLIGKRLSQLVALCADAQKGRLDVRAVPGRDDELGTVATAFNSMLQSIETKNAELATINASLEKIVEERTATITTIVNNVRSGIFLMDKALEIQDGLTRSCSTLLGPNARAGVTVPAALGLNEREATNFRLCVDEVFADFMPEEVTLDQIPRRFVVAGKVIKLEGAVVRDADKAVKHVLFTVNDVTELEKAERANHISQAIIKILGQRDAFLAFLADFRGAAAQCRAFLAEGKGQLEVRSALHTMKGNSAAFGLTEVASLIHHVEDGAVISADDIAAIEAAMRAFLAANSRVLNMAFEGGQRETIVIDRAHVESLRAAMESSANREHMLMTARSWMYEIQLKRAAELIGPLEDLVTGLASRLGKNVRLTVAGGDTPIDPEILSPVLQNLTHLIRNCVDHGIEAPHARGHKAETATVHLAIAAEGNGWMLRLGDDGQGIDLERVKAKAVQVGLVTAERAKTLTSAYALDLIFKDGLSTVDSVSDISGRGVGMAAVRRAVEAASGRIEVSTERGKGTEFKIWVPNPRGKDAKRAA